QGIRTASPSIPFADRKFGTETGKVELYSLELEKLGFDPLPFHEEPAESPYSTPEVFEEYPLIMISGRLRDRLHSQYTTVELGTTVTNYAHCTSCQECVKECLDEAIFMTPPSVEMLQEVPSDEIKSPARMRQELGEIVRGLAVSFSHEPLSIPDDITGLLVPRWDPLKCIGCRNCSQDVCPYKVVKEPINMPRLERTPLRRMLLRMHPDTATNLGLKEEDRVNIESIRGRIEGVRIEITDDIDPRVVWSSDGWWARDGNINLLTDDKHTAFGHTPGFNSVLVRISKA
ncbi:MAG: molybdopterin dinucleotide binding domain-containing protein, partial [Candidatus Hodarchaeota archaeon]